MGYKKGLYFSRGALIGAFVIVIVLLVAEGLLVGFLGHPTCEPSNAPSPDSSTTLPSKPETTASTTSEAPPVWENDRLPLHLEPTMYNVWLKPVLEKNNIEGMYIFYGASSVKYICRNSTDLIIIHSIDLNYTEPLIDAFKVFDVADGSIQTLVEVMFYKENEYLIIRTENSCLEGHEYNLTAFEFQGELGEELYGIYRSEYVNENGTKRVIATTQMEKTGARATFPCFDEPSFKAQFVITLLYRSDLGYLAVSNMPPVHDETVEDDFGVVWDSRRFNVTPLMSTYLLAMVVCDFEYENSNTSEGIQTRIYARRVPVKNGEIKYAAELTPLILDVISQHFNVAYPLPKSDQLAVPDFPFGAMENWGLVIYKEINMLYNKNVTSVYQKYLILENIAHEFAHQWFGNLVTTAWWSNIWLNEGFASYVQYIGIKGVRPTWKLDEIFVIDDLRAALTADDSSSSHPLYHPEGLFSTISYSKGASFIRMISNFMGEETFTNAITNYLVANQYSVATYETLFKYLAEEAEKDKVDLPAGVSLFEILEPWVVQMGYPLLTIDQRGNDFTISQEYFLIDPDDTPTSTPGSDKYNYSWYVPFTYKPSSLLASPDPTYVWMNPTESVTIGENGEDFILANVDAVGYYRVNYNLDMWKKISEKLRSNSRKEISPQNRAQLIEDVFAISRSYRISVEVALNLSSYLSSELNYIVWDSFTSAILYFDKMLASTEIYDEFKSFVVNMAVDSIYNEFGWDDSNTTEEAQIERMTRGLAINTACYYGHFDCIETAKSLYEDWMSHPESNPISSTYRKEVYCTAIRAGGVDEWDFAWQQYLTADSAQEKLHLRYGMSCSDDSWIINRYITYALNNTNVRNQDISSTLSDIASYESSKYTAWSYAVNNWDLMMSTVGSQATSSLLSSAKNRFSTEFDLSLITSLRDIAGPSWNSTLNLYYNEVVNNMEWRKEYEGKAKAWLRGEPTLEDLTSSRRKLKHKKLDTSGNFDKEEKKKAFHKLF